MDDLEYMIKLKEAREIAYQQKLDKRMEPFKDKLIKYLLAFLFVCSLTQMAKCYADYTVSYYVCSKCGSCCSSTSCCPGASFTGYEYDIKGNPP